MTIDILKGDHAKDCARIWDEVTTTSVVGGNWTEPQILYEIKNHRGLGAWSGGCNGELVAFALYRVVSDAVEIMCLATSPKHQRKGLMKSLLLSLIKNLDSNMSLWLEVHERNTAAIGLYEHLGFKPMGIRKSYYRDGSAALLFQYKPLQ